MWISIDFYFGFIGGKFSSGVLLLWFNWKCIALCIRSNNNGAEEKGAFMRQTHLAMSELISEDGFLIIDTIGIQKLHIW